MGRPHKDTEKIIRRLCDAISLGATYEMAAKYAGITPSTLRLWRAQGAQAKPGTRRRRLIERLDAAESKAVLGWLAQIEQAARQGAWQASAWRLERRYPMDYGRQVIQHEGETTLTGQPERQQLRAVILQALVDLPEARLRLAAVLTGELIAGEVSRNGSSNGTGH
jgi:hypothetical protein